MSAKFGYVVLWKGVYVSNRYTPDRYTVQYYEKVPPGHAQNRTCAALPPEVVSRCMALDMLDEHDYVDGLGSWHPGRGYERRYLFQLWAPLEDIFDLDPR